MEPFRGRSKYSIDDDKKIYSFVIEQLRKNRYDARHPRGNALWKLAEERKITNHSYQSMQQRFNRKLLPSVDSTSLLNSEEKALVKAKLHQYLPAEKKLVLNTDQNRGAAVNGNANCHGMSGRDTDDSGDISNDEAEHDYNKSIGTKSAAECEMDEDEERSKLNNNRGDDEDFDDEVETCVARWTQPLPERPAEVQNDDHMPGCSNVIREENADSIEQITENEGIQLRNRQVPERPHQQKPTRCGFALDDDIAMLTFLKREIETHNPHADFIKGNTIWKLAVDQGVTAHPAAGMRDRFRKVLLPNLPNLNVPDDLKRFILKRISMWNLPPHDIPNRRRQPSSKKGAKRPRSTSSDSDCFVVDADRSPPKRAENECAPNVDRMPLRRAASSSNSTVCSTVMSMALDGVFSDIEEMKRFYGIVNKLQDIAVQRNVSFTDVLNIAKSEKSLGEVKSSLSKN